jgi:hypothetical protein
MRTLRLLATAVLCATTARAAPVDVPRGVDHTPYDVLLRKYVNDRGLVNYAAWKNSADDLKAFHEYTAQFAPAGPVAEGNEKVASLVNAYNALTIQWILDNYPVKSIKNTKEPWGAKRHQVGGRLVSLDEIEHDTLRPLVGYRIHATLVCAARSCPPLRAGAYTADKLDEQLDDVMRRWLAREDLNKFDPKAGRAELSKIFSWYGGDFKKAEGGLPAVLEKFAPVKGDYKISYKSYNWELNAQ